MTPKGTGAKRPSGKAKAKPKAPAKPKAKPKAKAKAKPKAKPKASAKPKAAPPAPKPRRWRRAVRLACFFALGLVAMSALWAAAYRVVNPPWTPLMLVRAMGDGAGIEQTWLPLEELPVDAVLAVLASEDQRFFEHSGFDVDQIQNAISARLDGERLRGASTLSQQTAKNVFLWHGRSWVRKGLEVWFTLLIEWTWGKPRILEVYMNIAEWGPGVYGIEAAAQHHYGKPAADLTAEEAAALAAILPNPLEFSPHDGDGRVPRRAAWIAQQIRNLGGARFLAPLTPPAAAD